MHILPLPNSPWDTSTAAGKAFFDMLGVFAAFETNLGRGRQAEGILAAKQRVACRGRPPRIDMEAPRATARQRPIAHGNCPREGHLTWNCLQGEGEHDRQRITRSAKGRMRARERRHRPRDATSSSEPFAVVRFKMSIYARSGLWGLTGRNAKRNVSPDPRSSVRRRKTALETALHCVSVAGISVSMRQESTIPDCVARCPWSSLDQPCKCSPKAESLAECLPDAGRLGLAVRPFKP